MKIIFLSLLFNSIFFINKGQDPFESYVNYDEDWYPSIFQLYIEQYSGIHLNKYLIDGKDISSIKEQLKPYSASETSNLDEVIEATAEGKKVFFFIDNSVWGGLDQGTNYSGSWQRLMPLCSGFYISKKRCFQHEGLNFHLKFDDNSLLIFLIMK